MFREVKRVAQGAGCAKIMIFGDTSSVVLSRCRWAALEAQTHSRHPQPIEPSENEKDSPRHPGAFVLESAVAQLRSAMLVALTRGIITLPTALLCGGMTGSNQFDTLVSWTSSGVQRC